MRHRLGRGLAVAWLLLGLGQALGQTGTAVGVDPEAEAVLSGAPRQLVVGADVAIGETVVTGSEGKVELVFTDTTRLVVGPGSSLLIEDYLLRNDGSPGKFAVNALRGSFRFISGNSPKDAYEITTATGTIGVRGTAFDFVVDPQKRETHLVLFQGELQVCSPDGACADLVNRCEIVSFGTSGATILEGDKRAEWQGKFPFANFQSSVGARFRIDGAGSCMRGSVQDPQPLVTPGSGLTQQQDGRQDPNHSPPASHDDNGHTGNSDNSNGRV